MFGGKSDFHYETLSWSVKGNDEVRWGRIVNIGSVVGSTGNPGQGNYAAPRQP